MTKEEASPFSQEEVEGLKKLQNKVL